MLYENFFEMADTLLGYVKKHPGCRVVSSDDPLSLTIGFCTTYPEPWYFRALNSIIRLVNRKTILTRQEFWGIKLTRLKGSIAKELLPEDQLKNLQDVMGRVSGRAEIARGFTAGVKVWETVLH